MKNQTYILLIALFVLSTVKSFGQITTPSNTPFGVPPEYVGWDATATIPLEIRHNHTTTPQPINFFTNNTFRMTLSGANGFLGIGSAITTPAFQLEVADDINLIPGTFPNFGYRWQDSVIIRTNDVMTNIYYGRGAGKYVDGNSSANTYIGVESGKNNGSTGGGNRSGEENTSNLNTFVGYSSGNINTSGRNNAFLLNNKK